MDNGVNAVEYVSALMDRARKAQQIAESYSQEKVDELVTAVAWAAVREENAVKVARMAADEPRLGHYEGKYIKITKKTRGALRDLKGKKSVGVIETDEQRGIVKIAKPVGVVGAVVPCTNPEATPVMKAMFALKGRNAVVIAPHPRTRKTNKLISDIMREALKKHGAPEDLIIAVENPTLEISNEIMRQCDLIVATGGNAMVKAAYSSGTPAFGVGVGNACVVVDDTANIRDAAHKIMLSKTFDYATSCSADNSVIAVKDIYDTFLESLRDEGGYIVNMDEKKKLEKTMWVNGCLNRDIIAQSAQKIGYMSGFDPGNSKFIIVPEDGIGEGYAFSGEKLCVVLTLYKAEDFNDAVDKVNKITEYVGKGHSCGIHSNNEKNILRLALETKTGRIMVRQPTSAGNSGNWDNGMPFSLTLGCGTWGGNISSENITWKHMINTTWVSYPIEPHIPCDKDLFGDIMKE